MKKILSAICFCSLFGASFALAHGGGACHPVWKACRQANPGKGNKAARMACFENVKTNGSEAQNLPAGITAEIAGACKAAPALQHHS